MKETTYVYKNSHGKWVSGFPSRQSAVDATLVAGLTKVETASVTTEPPAYFVRFLASVALRKMIDGLSDGEKSGHVVDSKEARAILEKIAEAKISDGFPPTGDDSGHPEWHKVVDLMNRMQDAAATWFRENGLDHATVGFVDYGSTELHIKGTSLNVPLL
ncbi:hypothetical protein PQR02_38280 [Paraburkholderia sediminicola]|uniref:Uncharacterized protein n=1 Tax=Paraburkholderia rhynchosiae TaxID=487049 RepID=A0ACC7NPX0_9BURK